MRPFLRTLGILLAASTFIAECASAADETDAKRPHMVPLAFYLSQASEPADDAAIGASLRKVQSVSSVDFNAKAGYVRVVFDSHLVSYHQIAQAIAEAGKQTGKKYDPRLKMRVPEYATGDNAKRVDALLAGKRLNQRVRIEAIDKSKGEFLIHFLPLEIDQTLTGPQGFNGGHLNHPLHDLPPRGMGLTCIYAAETDPKK